MPVNKPTKTRDLRNIATWIITITGVFAIVCVIIFLFKTTKLNFSSSIDTGIFSDYGEFVGGIASAALSLAGIYLVIQTINENRENSEKLLEESRMSFSKEQIESRFFELLKIHNDNRNKITAGDTSTFESLLDEYYNLQYSVEAINSERPKKLSEGEVANITYVLFYFGVFTEPIGSYFQHVTALLRKYDLNYDLAWVTVLINKLKSKRDELQEKSDFPEIYKYYFTGHHEILGQYFRHLFQTVKYINDSQILSYKEKYNYIKTLRAQFSTFEQILFYQNSISDLGKPWEFEEGLDENHKLITKYNLIKNVPVYINRYSSIKTRFDLVFFESDSVKSESRKALERIYL